MRTDAGKDFRPFAFQILREDRGIMIYEDPSYREQKYISTCSLGSVLPFHSLLSQPRQPLYFSISILKRARIKNRIRF